MTHGELHHIHDTKGLDDGSSRFHKVDIGLPLPPHPRGKTWRLLLRHSPKFELMSANAGHESL